MTRNLNAPCEDDVNYRSPGFCLSVSDSPVCKK